MTVCSILSPVNTEATDTASATAESSHPLWEFLMFSPAPWMFFGLGLWLAYLLWQRKYLLRLRESRVKHTALANRLRSVTDHQTEMIDTLNHSFASEKKRWGLQVTNRDRLLKDLNLQVAQFDDATRQHERDMAARNNELSQVKTDLAEKIDAGKSLAAELANRDQLITGLKHDLSAEGSLAKRIRQLEEELNQRDQLISDLKFDHKTANDAHQEKIREWEQAKGELEGQVSQLNQQLESSNQEHQRVCKEHHALTEEVNQLGHLPDVIEERERWIKDGETYRIELENRINVLEQTISEKDEALYAYEIEVAEKDETSQRVLELDGLLENRNLEVNQLRSETESTKSELSGKLHEQENRVRELEAITNERDGEIAHLRSELKTSQGHAARIDELEEIVGGRDRELEHLRHERLGLENQINELELSVSEKDTKINTLETDLTDKQGARQLLDEVDGILEKRDEEVNQLRDDRESLRDQLEQRIVDLEQTLTDKDSEIETIQKENESSGSEIAHLQQQLKNSEALSGQIDQLENQLVDRDHRIETANKDRIELENRINELELELTGKTNEIYALESDLNENRGARQKLSEIDGVIDERDSRMNQLREQREQTKTELGDRINQLEAELSDREEELSELRKTAGDKQSWSEKISQLNGFLHVADHTPGDLTTNSLANHQNDPGWNLYQLESSVKENASEMEKLREQLQHKDQEIDKLRELNDNIFNQLESANQEAHERSQLEQRINELETKLADRGREIEGICSEKDDIFKKLQDTEWILGERDEQLRVANCEKDDFRQQLDHRNGETETLRGEVEHKKYLETRIGELESLLQERSKDIEGLRFEKEGMAFELTERVAEISELQVERDEQIQHHPRVTELENLLGERDSEIAGLRSEMEQLGHNLAYRENELQTKINELEESLGERDSELHQLRSKLDDQKGSDRIQELEWLLGERDGQIAGLQHDTNEKEKKASQRTSELEWLLAESDSKVTNLQNELSEKDKTIEGLNQNEYSGYITRIQELEWLLGERDAEVNRLQNENQNSDSRSRIEELEWLLGERDAELANLRTENSHLHHSVDEKENAIRDLKEGEGSNFLARIQELEWLLGERDGELQGLRKEKISLDQKLSFFSGEPDDRFNLEMEKNRAQIEDLEQKLIERVDELEALRAIADNSESLTAKLQQTEAKLDQLQNNRHSTTGFEDQDISEDDRLGIIFRSQPSQVDDLKQIHGVAEVLEQKLNHIGIYHYRQIAGWTDQQITEFGEQLAFKDRIGRDLWVHQAIDLHRQKYGEDLAPRVSIYHKPATKKSAAAVGADPEATLFSGEAVTTDSQLGIIYQKRPAKVDDLKQINGIADVLEKQLHEHGIYRFKQIAIWNQDQITEFGERLVFKDRIGRDQWIPQAIDLHRRNHGEFLAPRIDLYQKPKPSAKPAPDKSNGSKHPDPTIIHERDAFANERVKIDRLLGPIFNSRPDQVDDLSRLEDITDQFVEKLHNFGVYRYKQIALWSPSHAEQFRLLLSVNGNGRLEIGEWITQAEELHRETHNEIIER